MTSNQLKNYKERNELNIEIEKIKKEVLILESKKEIKELEKIILKGLKKRIELFKIRESILMDGIIRESIERKKDSF